MTAPAVPIAALSRLNAHARAPSSSNERDAIYAYKTLAALILAAEGAASLRFVRWRGKCVYCDKGRYHHWDWEPGYTVACRDCGGSGVRVLRFTETTLPGGHVWHHPWNGRTLPGLYIARAAAGAELQDDGEYRLRDGSLLEWQDPGEWRPMLPAERLPLAELVALLNQVEDWVDIAPPSFGWPRDRALNFLRQRRHTGVIGDPSHGYRLDLGRAGGGCFVCGDAANIVIHFGRMTPLFHWSLPVCVAHRDAPHPTDPPPASLITPEVRRWLERHEQIEVAA